jgi:hypothetical protein
MYPGEHKTKPSCTNRRSYERQSYGPPIEAERFVESPQKGLNQCGMRVRQNRLVQQRFKVRKMEPVLCAQCIVGEGGIQNGIHAQP